MQSLLYGMFWGIKIWTPFLHVSPLIRIPNSFPCTASKPQHQQLFSLTPKHCISTVHLPSTYLQTFADKLFKNLLACKTANHAIFLVTVHSHSLELHTKSIHLLAITCQTGKIILLSGWFNNNVRQFFIYMVKLYCSSISLPLYQVFIVTHPFDLFHFFH